MACDQNTTPPDAGDVHTTVALEDFLLAFRENWVKAGPPGPQVTIAMVQEINQLRSALERLAGESEQLRLAILGGEDVPGLAASTPLAQVLEIHCETYNNLRWDAEAARSERDAALKERDDVRTMLRAWQHRFEASFMTERAARERAEAALREIADQPTGGVGCNPENFVCAARAALQPQGGSDE